ncbi:MAG TPA: hypothetical protein VGN37_16700 [Actinocatenispora sp.]
MIGGAAVGAVTGLVDVAALEDRLGSGPDLRVSLELSRYENGYSVAFADRYRPTPHQRQLMAGGGSPWESLFNELMAAGAWRIAHSTISVDVAGRRNQVIRIVDMRLVPRQVGVPKPAAAGTLFDEPPQGGGPATMIGFDLDSPHPVAQVFDSVKGFGARYFPSHLYTLRKDEVGKFEVELRAAKPLRHEFTIAIDYLVGSHPHTVTLGDPGHPHVFRVTGSACAEGGSGYTDGYTMAYEPVVHLEPLGGQPPVCPDS